jgi:hypothetical protein
MSVRICTVSIYTVHSTHPHTIHRSKVSDTKTDKSLAILTEQLCATVKELHSDTLAATAAVATALHYSVRQSVRTLKVIGLQQQPKLPKTIYINCVR